VTFKIKNLFYLNMLNKYTFLTRSVVVWSVCYFSREISLLTS